MKVSELLSKQEIKYFTEKSDLQASWMFAFTWGSIFAIFTMAYLWTNPFMVLLAIVLLGGRQLALAILMHDCGHRVFFTSDWVNQFLGQWFASKPILQDMPIFAKDHLIHHRAAGTTDDPDLNNYKNYPVTKASFKRKMLRDITGQTGIKLLAYVVMSAKGIFDPNKRQAAKPFAEMIFANIVLAVVVSLLMSPWVYLLWFAALMTSYMVVIRIRQVAEHGAVPDLFHEDPRQHARTTIPSWWERMLMAPNYVNYHLEHHFMASVPCYRLAELHQLLKMKGAYTDTRIFNKGYVEVVRHAIGAEA